MHHFQYQKKKKKKKKGLSEDTSTLEQKKRFRHEKIRNLL